MIIDMATLLPFFFVLAVVYGGLEISKVFKNSRVKAVISLVIAFFAVSSQETVAFINAVMPYAALFFVGFFFLGFAISFFKKDGHGKKDYVPVAVGLGLLLLFLSNSSFLDIVSIRNQNFIGTVALLVILLIIYAAYRAEKD